MMPETFPQDMETIFGCDPKTDILCGLSCGFDGASDCVTVLLNKDIAREDILIKLADYVNGIGLNYIFCAFPNEKGIKCQYELEINDEYVEGPNDLYIQDCGVVAGEYTLLIGGPLRLGMDVTGEPSTVATDIAKGIHYIKELIDVNGSPML